MSAFSSSEHVVAASMGQGGGFVFLAIWLGFWSWDQANIGGGGGMAARP